MILYNRAWISEVYAGLEMIFFLFTDTNQILEFFFYIPK